jgi:hypothetical protein
LSMSKENLHSPSSRNFMPKRLTRLELVSGLAWAVLQLVFFVIVAGIMMTFLNAEGTTATGVTGFCRKVRFGVEPAMIRSNEINDIIFLTPHGKPILRQNPRLLPDPSVSKPGHVRSCISSRCYAPPLPTYHANQA